jgi:hypothetical protein
VANDTSCYQKVSKSENVSIREVFVAPQMHTWWEEDLWKIKKWNNTNLCEISALIFRQCSLSYLLTKTYGLSIWGIENSFWEHLIKSEFKFQPLLSIRFKRDFLPHLLRFTIEHDLNFLTVKIEGWKEMKWRILICRLRHDF